MLQHASHGSRDPCRRCQARKQAEESWPFRLAQVVCQWAVALRRAVEAAAAMEPSNLLRNFKFKFSGKLISVISRFNVLAQLPKHD